MRLQKLHRMRCEEVALMIERLLADGEPRVPLDMCRELQIDYYRVAEALRMLRRATPPRASIVGEWYQLAALRGLELGHTRKDAGVYSCPGAEPLPPAELKTSRYEKRKSRRGSGVIAPPPYRTGYRWGGLPA